MAFEPELDHLFHPKLYFVKPQPQPLSLAEIGARIAKAYPGQVIGLFILSTSPDISWQADLPHSRIYVNQYTGEILGERPDGMDFLGYVHQLHIRLLLMNTGNNDVGKKFVTWANVGMLFLIFSGLYLWWPAKRVTILWSGSSRRFWFDVHNVAGISSLGFLLALTITGAVIGFEHTVVPMLYKMTGSTPSRMPGPPPPPPPGSQPITPDHAVEIARAALPGAAPFMINVPKPGEVYRISARYPEDLTPGGRSRIMIDAYGGRVLWAEGSRSAPAGTRMVIANRAIHTGDLLGMPGKTLMSLASLMVVVQAWSGLVMWLRRESKKRKK
jgi:uncharacterized iron-regulated membrane protein